MFIRHHRSDENEGYSHFAKAVIRSIGFKINRKIDAINLRQNGGSRSSVQTGGEYMLEGTPTRLVYKAIESDRLEIYLTGSIFDQ